jgi:membrane protein YfhO
VIGLAALVAFLFHRALFSGGVFFQRDVQLLWFAHVEAFVRAVAGGAWPVWNPLLAFGQPLWADANAQLGYPPTWLNLVLRPWQYYTLYVAAHALLGAIGLYALARRLELGREAALVAAALWTASGPVVSTAPMWNQLAGAAWLPWSVLAAETALDTGRSAHAVLWGATLAAPILAGSPEGALLAAMLGGAVAVGRIFGGAGRARLGRVAFCVGIAGVFALALSAVQWLPSLEAARRSARAGLGPEARAYWSVHPLALLQTVFPVLVDTPGLRPDLSATLSDSREPYFASLYLGLAAGGLVLASRSAPARRRRRFLVGAMMAGALVALGRHTPLYEAAVAVLPPLRALRYPAKAMTLVAFAWALLAGMGLQAWPGPPAEERRFRLRVLLPLAALTGAAAAGALLILRDPERWGAVIFPAPAAGLAFADLLRPTSLRLIGAALAGTTVLVTAALGERIPSSTRGTVIAVCAVADLLWAHHTLNPTAPPALYTHRPELLEVVRPADGARIYVYDYFFPGRSQGYLGRAAPYVVARAPAGWPVRAAQALGMRLYLFPPTAGPWGLEGSYDLDVPGLGSPHVAALTDLLRNVEGTPAHTRLLRIGAVSHVVALHSAGFEDLELVGSVEGLFPDPMRVYRVPDPRPRTYAVAGARAADGDDAVRTLLDPAFDPAREVVLAGGPAARADPSFSGLSRLVARDAERITVEAELSRNGYVVLVDAWDPAWQATVDGQPADLLRANVAFRAVAVSAGRHHIEMRYRPVTLSWGLVITGVALAAGAVVAGRRPIS